MSTLWIIGCGGVTNHFLDFLIRSPLPEITRTILVDGDVFTEHNLRRQVFAEPGRNKAEALAERVGPYLRGETVGIPEFLTERLDTPALAAHFSRMDPVVLCAVDSNIGRRAARALAIKLNAPMLICANEATSFSAIWVPVQHGCVADALERWFPEWFTTAPAVTVRPSCSAPQADPQTAIANAGAALAGYNLLRAWLPYLADSAPIQGLGYLALDEQPPARSLDLSKAGYVIPIELGGTRFNFYERYLTT
jgi:hypothetical protein